MPNTYTTRLGDTWDIVSHRVYGSELFVADLVSENWRYRDLAIFSSGVVLTLPAVSTERIDDTNLPPWRRGQAAINENEYPITDMINDYLDGNVPLISPEYVNKWADRIYVAARLGE